MVNAHMLYVGSKRSAIRELFEFGRMRKAEVGHDKVYDFSLGNPSVPAPKEVDAAIREIIDTRDPVAIHGYTSAVGSDECRDAIAASLEARYGGNITKRNIFVTCGAAAALTACFAALTVDDKSEFIAIAPYFPEYNCFSSCAGGHLTVVPADTAEFQINFFELEARINEHTQAVIINSPNNPSGVIYTADTIERLAALLKKKSAEYARPIYIISDEPYRELVYDNTFVPYVPNYYSNTLVCYSYSKTLSLPGERIGYIMVPNGMADFDDVCDATVGAARTFGYVCAPALIQAVVAKCVDVAPDLEAYKKNRDCLFGALREIGYECAIPSGAFYLFVKAPNGSASEFSALAKARDLLVVDGTDFGCPEFFRLSYCVSYDTIVGAIPAFKALYDEITGK